LGAVRRLVDAVGDIAGAGLLVYCALVIADIVSRRAFGVSFHGTDEIGGYMMSAVVAFGFSAALFDRAHVRIDLFLPRLPRIVSHWLNVAASVALLAYALFLMWGGVAVFRQSYSMSAVSPTSLAPLTIPQFVWLFGLGLFVVAALVCVVACVRPPGLREESGLEEGPAGSGHRGKRPEESRLIGPDPVRRGSRGDGEGHV